MRKVLERTKDGWAILGLREERLRHIRELSFVADIKHGLALFPGTEESVGQSMDRIRRRCRKDAESLSVVSLGRDIDEAEASYMMVTYRLPRRVLMRLK